MAKRGRDCSVLFNGYDLSRFFNQASPNASVDMLDGTPFQAPGGDKVWVPSYVDGKLSLEGFYESDSVDEAAVDDVINAAIGVEAKQVVTIAPEGAATLGNRAYLLDSDVIRYAVQSAVDAIIQCNAEIQSSSGLGNGVILHPLAATATTGNGASVDNGAASSRGGAGHLHVTAFGGTTPTLNAKIQDSDDDSTWVDLITFTEVEEALTAERVEVTGTVERYTRAARTLAGSGATYTMEVAFARFN
jgi:hypothetical protein